MQGSNCTGSATPTNDPAAQPQQGAQCQGNKCQGEAEKKEEAAA